jgi:hypothetical protein
MICLDIKVNGDLVCQAGIANASILSSILGASVGADHPVDLYVSGMCELPEERTAHVYWAKDRSLSSGDHITFTLIDCEDATEPTEIVPTDSREYLEEQAKFEELEGTFVRDEAPAERRWPSQSFDCRINNEPKAIAVLAPDEEHILCSVTWDKWRPEQCHVFVRSFGGSTKTGIEHRTEWVRATLLMGDCLEVRAFA